MKQVAKFLRTYKLFSFGLITGLVGLGLQLLGYHTASHWTIGVVCLIAVVPLLLGMIEDVRTGSYGIDILAATAIVTSVILGQYWAALVIVLMLTGGESLEDFAEHRAKSELGNLLQHVPQKAHVIRNRKTIDIKAAEVHVGDKLIIKPGEVVPVDAVIIEGESNFDESNLSGESLPENRGIGGQILSGSVNLEGEVTAKATATAHDSQYQQIVRLVRSASSSQAPFVRLADRYSIPFTLTAFAIAGAVWIISGHAIRFLEVIVVATPCPLLLAAPIALVSGMSRASKHGIVVRTGSAFEKLAEAEVFAFDKTGTLTHGTPKVDTVTALGSFSKDKVLSLAASLEQSSNHVLAAAIVEAASSQKLKLAKAKKVQEIPGRGLVAVLKGQEILVGRLSLLKDQGVDIPAKLRKGLEQTATFVAVDGKVAGYITFHDELREESQATITRLRSLGIKKLMMVTGDNQKTAAVIAKKLGITHVHAEMLPADKLHVVEKETGRPIVFIGDGVNDAPVLTAADVGIALGAKGSTAASESADVVILRDDVGLVAVAVAMAKRTFNIATQSIIIGILLSIVLMIAFATGKFPPLAGAIVQEVVDVVVIFNALRAHRDKVSSR